MSGCTNTSHQLKLDCDHDTIYASTLDTITKEQKLPVTKYRRQEDADTDQLIVRDSGDLYCESIVIAYS